MRLVAARTIVRLERHLESQASQKVNLNKLDREKEREKERDRNFIHLYDIIEPSLSLSLDQKQTTREGKNIRKTQNEEKYRKQWGKGDEEEERKTREWKEEREREAHVCVSYESTQYVNSRWWPHQETCSPLESRVFVSRAPCIIIRARVI